mmetsp:Transcript_18912/g.48504  ORF Transcript_18912/g.48504 Transcript_18912/m.48504 type:complete len:364 (+) Transcript_18912:459-1550(+)
MGRLPSLLRVDDFRRRARTLGQLPDLPRVVHHAAVRAELASGAGGLDAARHEGRLVLVLPVHTILTIDVGREVVDHKVLVTIPGARRSRVVQHVQDRADLLGELVVTSAEAARADGIEDLAQAPVHGVVAILRLLQDARQLLLARAEDEVVRLATGLFADLHIGPVHGAHNEAAVHHELHVRGTARLGARRGDVLRGVGRRDDLLRRGDAVVRQERELQVRAHIRIVVDHVRDVVDELDDRLRTVVPGRRLAADAGEALLHLGPIRWGHALDLHVPVDLVESVHELALVLVDALHLHVDERVGVHVQVAVLLHPLRHPLLRLLLHGHPLRLEVLVILELADAADEREVLQPGVAAKLLRDELR